MKIYQYSMGCKLNQTLSNRVLGNYLSEGCIETENPEDADIILVSGCIVTETGEKQFLRNISKLTNENPGKKFMISGCIPKNFRMPGNAAAEIIDQMSIMKIEKGYTKRTRAEIVIQTGCNRFCAYCIVPYLRGREVSVNPQTIANEVKQYVQEGKKEIVLTGVHIGKYSYEGYDLAKLLEFLKKTGISRIRLSSIDISELNDSLIREIAENDVIARFLHIPIQHTEEKILRSMKRFVRKSYMLERISILKESLKDIRIGADVIVGYPMETDDDFYEMAETLNGMDITHFHIFPFSSRTGTLASYMEKEKSELTKNEKVNIIKEIQKRKKTEYEISLIGKTEDVIIEDVKDGCGIGKTGHYSNCRVLFDGTFKKGDMINVLITESKEGYLVGKR